MVNNYELTVGDVVYKVMTDGNIVKKLSPDPVNGALLNCRLITTARVLCGLGGQDVRNKVAVQISRVEGE